MSHVPFRLRRRLDSHGSRREIPQENGLAHFIEHDGFFKRHGAPLRRSHCPRNGFIGGMLDAFQVQRADLLQRQRCSTRIFPSAFDIISDLCLHPRFDSADVKTNSRFVLEEIKMDMAIRIPSPRNVYPRFSGRASAWPHPFGHARNCRKSFHPKFLHNVFKDGSRRIICLSPRPATSTHDQVYRPRRKAIRPSQAQRRPRRSRRAETSATDPDRSQTTISGRYIYASVFLSFPSRTIVALSSQCSINLSAAACLRRLFQNIREKRGLAYAVSVRSHRIPTPVCSRFTPAAQGNHRARSWTVTVCGISRAQESPVSDEELLRAKKSSQGFAHAFARVHQLSHVNLARQELYFGRFFTARRNSRVH